MRFPALRVHRRQGSLIIEYGYDPEFEKFRNSLPDALKNEAKAMWKEWQKRQAQHPKPEAPAIKNQTVDVNTTNTRLGQGMTTQQTIIIAAAILGIAYLAANLYRIENGNGPWVWRVNSLTGAVALCGAGKCISYQD